ncbi:hypothetical protein Cni_G01406 [Canna indica]|uniref:Uncharacterized protein n=1 Tax=Canna indica TaxID=4628 RepID=A0AAQ3PY68_9LILI|nr:hypothetical protein Cni_G01406 [Canna indica]
MLLPCVVEGGIVHCCHGHWQVPALGVAGDVNDYRKDPEPMGTGRLWMKSEMREKTGSGQRSSEHDLMLLCVDAAARYNDHAVACVAAAPSSAVRSSAEGWMPMEEAARPPG